ncbi:MAG: tetratricopeptide repeat protein [Deltaproteobacteria bacterium]|nr:tetratricopeptide repeat protein [Deltaproteobacteria bacterium]MBN2673479.1 tetratricopeptide repeat protein [Deltaproteobacteria bacterium]
MATNKSKIIAAAQKYAGKGNFEKAVAEYQKVLKIDPNDIRTWLKMGDLYTRMGARREATDTYLKVAEQYRRGGFHLKAVAVYKQILKLDPLLTDVYELLGDAYLSLGLTSEALIQFEQLADIAARQQKQHIVVDTLHKILELDPNNVSTRLRVGEQMSAAGESEQAIEQFRVACEQLKTQDRIDDYLKVAERLLYHDNTQLDIARDVAQKYLERNDPKRALSKLQLCFNANRKDVMTLEMLAASFSMLQQPQKAISVYTELMNIAIANNNVAQKHGYAKSILKLDPNHKVARREMGSNASIPLDAGPAAEPAHTVTGPEAVVAKLLDEAEVLLKYGLIERATEHFDKIFTLDFYNLEARERFKDVLIESGNIKGAKEQLFILVDAFAEAQPEGAVYYLHQVLQIDPKSRRARQRLQEIGGVMPDGLPELADGEISEHSGLLEVENVAPRSNTNTNAARRNTEQSGYEVSIDDLPEVGADDGAALIEDSQIDIIPVTEGTGEHAAAPFSPSNKAPALPRPSLLPKDKKGVNFPPPPPPSMPPRPSSAGVQLPRPASIAPPPRASAAPLPKPKPASQDDLISPADALAHMSTPPEEPKSAPEPKPASALLPQPEATKPTAPNTDADIGEELEEIEFFLEQGLVEEARVIYDDLMQQYPDDSRLAELAPKFASARDIAESNDLGDDIQLQDDSALNMDELSSDLNLDDITEEQGEVAVDTVFTKFKEGVEKQISKSDYDTHFDLGQAYKEMGLWDDAIGEFKIAAEHPDRAGTAEMMVGMCHVGAERYEEAIATFDAARELPGQSESEKLALLYEKAKVYELMGQPEDALVIYNDILNVDPGFADVVDRIDELEA